MNLAGFLGQNIEAIGMTPAAIMTTVFGMFVFVFVVNLCWGRMVEDFGPYAGIFAAGLIVGSIWVMNHALPGVGIGGEFAIDANGNTVQPGLIQQAFDFGGPWIDMGWAAAVGLFVASAYAGASVKRAIPSLAAAIIGGAIGGVAVGLISYTYEPPAEVPEAIEQTVEAVE
jgi:hypothetical protein